MILVNDILVDEKISETHFNCELTKCRGACCTFPGEYGAPVLEEEIKPMMEALPEAMEYLSERSIRTIEEDGFVRGSDGSFTTVCIDKKDCVFVYYQGDIALCSLERAFTEGKTNFRKPVSCHLFPIRVGQFEGKYLYYEKISECSPALKNGKKSGIKIHESVKEALVRSFGEEWYQSYLTKVNNGLVK